MSYYDVGEMLLELIDAQGYYKNFVSKVSHRKEIFDLTNWKFFVTYNKMIVGFIVVIKTNNCNML